MPKNINVKELIVGSPDSLSDLSLSPGDTMEAIFGHTEGNSSPEQKSPYLLQDQSTTLGAANYNTTVTPKPIRGSSLKSTATTHLSATAQSTHDSTSMKHEEDPDDDAAAKILFDLSAKLQRMRDNNAFILDKTKLLNEKWRLIKEAEEETERLQLELLELCQREHEGNKEKEVKLEQENEELSKKIGKIHSDTKDMSVNVIATKDSMDKFQETLEKLNI